MELDFQFFEITAIHALGFGYRDEGILVDAVDDLHEVLLVGAMNHNDKHLLAMVGVASLGIEEGGTATHFGGDGIADFLVLLREHHHLIGLLVAVDDHIQHIGHGNHYNIAEHHILNLMGDKERTSDDKDIEVHDYLARGNIVVLAEDEGDDVGTAGVAAHGESKTDASTTEGTADDGAHEASKL